jgi:hypothetical protein
MQLSGPEQCRQRLVNVEKNGKPMISRSENDLQMVGFPHDFLILSRIV